MKTRGFLGFVGASFLLFAVGSVLTMSASDLVKFGMAHVNNGRTCDGHVWMSEASVRAMREPCVTLPSPTLLLRLLRSLICWLGL